ncbi:hypothetical protein GEMRC1_007443 [Eukaryota sp. GEM-RC1]
MAARERRLKSVLQRVSDEEQMNKFHQKLTTTSHKLSHDSQAANQLSSWLRQYNKLGDDISRLDSELTPFSAFIDCSNTSTSEFSLGFSSLYQSYAASLDSPSSSSHYNSLLNFLSHHDLSQTSPPVKPFSLKPYLIQSSYTPPDFTSVKRHSVSLYDQMTSNFEELLNSMEVNRSVSVARLEDYFEKESSYLISNCSGLVKFKKSSLFITCNSHDCSPDEFFDSAKSLSDEEISSNLSSYFKVSLHESRYFVKLKRLQKRRLVAVNGIISHFDEKINQLASRTKLLIRTTVENLKQMKQRRLQNEEFKHFVDHWKKIASDYRVSHDKVEEIILKKFKYFCSDLQKRERNELFLKSQLQFVIKGLLLALNHDKQIFNISDSVAKRQLNRQKKELMDETLLKCKERTLYRLNLWTQKMESLRQLQNQTDHDRQSQEETLLRIIDGVRPTVSKDPSRTFGHTQTSLLRHQKVEIDQSSSFSSFLNTFSDNQLFKDCRLPLLIALSEHNLLSNPSALQAFNSAPRATNPRVDMFSTDQLDGMVRNLK